MDHEIILGEKTHHGGTYALQRKVKQTEIKEALLAG